MKINTKHLLLSLLLLLPITTLLQAQIPIINRAFFVCIILFLTLIAAPNTYSKWEHIALIGIAISVIIPIFMTRGPAESFNLYFYFPFFVLYALFVSKKFDYFVSFCERSHSYIKKIAIIWNVLVFISLFFKSSYVNGYFTSFTGNSFRSATASSFVLALVLIVSVKEKKCALLSIMPMYCMFSGGSRTYLAIGLATMVLLLYIVTPSTKVFWRWLIPLGIIAFIILLNSTIFIKFTESLTVSQDDFFKDPLRKFTSGRSVFWEADLREFFDTNFLRQLFGNGHNFVYDVNEKAFGGRVWGHNDFINILLTHGYLGLVLYMYYFVKMFKACTKSLRLPWYINALLIFIWLFNAFFNMYYTYVCASASYPFILIAFSLAYKVKQERILLQR